MEFDRQSDAAQQLAGIQIPLDDEMYEIESKDLDQKALLLQSADVAQVV